MTVEERKLRREELHLEWLAKNMRGSRQHAEAVVRYFDLKLARLKPCNLGANQAR